MTSPLHAQLGWATSTAVLSTEKAASSNLAGPILFLAVPKSLNMCTHTCMFMSTKTITVTEDSYSMLKSAKREDESFSELILRTHKKGSWEAVSKFIGAWEHVPDKVVEDMKTDIKNMRKRSARRLFERTRDV